MSYPFIYCNLGKACTVQVGWCGGAVPGHPPACPAGDPEHGTGVKNSEQMTNPSTSLCFCFGAGRSHLSRKEF